MTTPGDAGYDGEKVIHETKLHWVALLKEILYTVGLLIVFIFLVSLFDNVWGWVYIALIAVWAIASFRGVSNWFTTKLVLTNRRVIVKQGLISKKGYEIPIDRVQDVAFSQSAIQRMVGAGDLLVESGASSGRTALRNVPDPEKMKRLISEAREQRIDQRFSQAGQSLDSSPSPSVPQAAPGTTRAEQLDILARLHSSGSLTDAEFEAEKAKLLGGQ